MIRLGKLKEIKGLSRGWPHEAIDFTPWLAEEDNLALLAGAVGLRITYLISYPADFDNKDKCSEQFDWAMDVALKMKNTLKKYLQFVFGVDFVAIKMINIYWLSE